MFSRRPRASDLVAKINALRAECSLPPRKFPGTSIMALQIVLSETERAAAHWRTNPAALAAINSTPNP